MVRNIRLLCLLLLLLIVACSQTRSPLLEKQLDELNEMQAQALEIKNSIPSKNGEEYLSGYDKYYDIMVERVNKARKYLDKANLNNPTIIDLTNLAKIAEIARKEQQLIDILKEIFTRFPSSKSDKRLLKMYFPYAYLLEPEKIEDYVDLKIFSHNEQIECYYALALGCCERGNNTQAAMYLANADAIYKQLLAEGVQRNTIQVVHNAGLKSFIEYKLGNTADAFKTLNDLQKAYPDAYSQKQLQLFTTRLKLLGETAKSIEYQFWVGADDPVDLAALKGKVVLLAFFTWNCDVCAFHLPSLFELQDQFDNDFMIIGVTQYTGSQSFTEIREFEYLRDQFYKHRKIGWPVSIARNDFMDDYGISNYPAYILIDKEGIIQDGYYISHFAYLKQQIELLLNN